MKNTISVNKYLLTFIIISALVVGSYAGFYYTSEYYKEKEASELRKEIEIDENSLICEARIQYGRTGDVKSNYFILERSIKREDCERFIKYNNIPDDTEWYWSGL